MSFQEGGLFFAIGDSLRTTRSTANANFNTVKRRLRGAGNPPVENPVLTVSNEDQSSGVRALTYQKPLMSEYGGDLPESFESQMGMARMLVMKLGNNPGGAGAPAGFIYPNIVTGNAQPPLMDIQYHRAVAAGDVSNLVCETAGAWAESLSLKWDQTAGKVLMGMKYLAEYPVGQTLVDASAIQFAGADSTPVYNPLDSVGFNVMLQTYTGSTINADILQSCELRSAGFTLTDKKDSRFCAGATPGLATATYYDGNFEASVSLQIDSDAFVPSPQTEYRVTFKLGTMYVVFPYVSIVSNSYGRSGKIVTWQLEGKGRDNSGQTLDEPTAAGVDSTKQFIVYVVNATTV